MSNFDLNEIIINPKSNQISKILVFLHGYGADNENVREVGQYFADNIRDLLVCIPNGFYECESGAGGGQWFSLEGWGVNSWKERIKDGVIRINIYLDDLLVKYSIPEENLILSGFSQGGMLALQAGLSRKVSSIIAFSSTLVDDSVLNNKISIPKVLLVNGSADTVIPINYLYETIDSFKHYNLEDSLKAEIINNGEHFISLKSLEKAINFLNE